MKKFGIVQSDKGMKKELHPLGGEVKVEK